MKIYNAKPAVFVDENLNRPLKVFTATTGEEMFVGSTHIQMDPKMAPMELPFEIEATSIQEAYEKYDDAAEVEYNRIKHEIEEQQREASIVTPKKDIII